MAQLVHGPRSVRGREPPLCAFFFLLGTLSAPSTTPFGAHGVCQPMGIKHALPRRRIFGAPSGACAFSFCVDGQRSATGGGRRKKEGARQPADRVGTTAPSLAPFFPSLLFSRLLAVTTPAALLSRPIRPRRRFSSIPAVRPSPSARAQSLSLSLPFDIAAARRKSRQRKEDEAKGRYGKKHIETEGPREKEEADGIQSALWHLPPSPLFFR